MPNYVVDIEWPLSGMEVNKSFTASVKVRNEDDIPGGPAGNHFVKCTIFKGSSAEDSGLSLNFDPDTEPLVSVSLTALTPSSHRLVAELIPAGATVAIATDEEANIRINMTSGPSVRPSNFSINPE